MSTSSDQVVKGDLNADGRDDLVAISGSAQLTGLLTRHVWLGQEDGTFGDGTPAAGITAPGWLRGSTLLVVGDIDGNHHDDILATSRSLRDIDVLTADSNLSLSPAPLLSTEVRLTDLKLIDLDVDGIADLVGYSNLTQVADSNLTPMVSVSLGKGDGTFAAPQLVSVPALEDSYLSTGDFNEDGTPDLAFVSITSNRMFLMLTSIAP